MSGISSSIGRGRLNLPGADAASKAAAERLVKRDLESHHCYFLPAGLHNHLSHHILAAYDMGASASLIQAIYDEEAKIQRPIDLKENGAVPEGSPRKGEIMEDNWTKWLGDARAYSAYVTFFSTQVSRLGIVKTLEDYVFSPAANGNGSHMLIRLFGGALHPLIQVGNGLEFHSEMLVAAGLGQAAIHDPRAAFFVNSEKFTDAAPCKAKRGRQPRTGPSILSILRQIYDSPKLVPVLPYQPGLLLQERFKDIMERDGGSRVAEMNRIFAQFNPGDTHEELDERVEELAFTATLLTFGTGRKGRKPRLDFFVMHLLTSALFVPSYFKYIPSIDNKKALLRTFLQPWGTILVATGRPRIDPALLMSYTERPVPPNLPEPSVNCTAIGGKDVLVSNPWPAIISDVLHAPDAHTIKTARSLVHAATIYGTVSKGDVIGAFDVYGNETHPGIAEVDGTIFIRAAGVLMDTLGWVTHGQAEGQFDRSNLGWDDAWKNED